MPKLLIADLKENEAFQTTFLVGQKSRFVAKNSRPYLSIKLLDCSGEAEGRVWDQVDEIDPLFEKKDFIRAEGRAVLYQEKLQLNLTKIVRLNPEQVDLADFLPVSKRNIDEMYQLLLALVRSEVKNPWILKLLLTTLEDPTLAPLFKRAPAAKTNHHAWIGGLLEHVLHLCEIGRDLLKHYPSVNPDLVYTGLIFHDFGKVYELSYERSFDYTDEGQLIGHLIQGVELVYEKIRALPGFPPKLKNHVIHLILSHHGQLEFGSPKLPMTQEAIFVHYLDDLDSKIQGILDLAARERPTEENSRWIGFNRLFGRPIYKRSLEDVKESLEDQV